MIKLLFDDSITEEAYLMGWIIPKEVDSKFFHVFSAKRGLQPIYVDLTGIEKLEYLTGCEFITMNSTLIFKRKD